MPQSKPEVDAMNAEYLKRMEEMSREVSTMKRNMMEMEKTGKPARFPDNERGGKRFVNFIDGAPVISTKTIKNSPGMVRGKLGEGETILEVTTHSREGEKKIEMEYGMYHKLKVREEKEIDYELVSNPQNPREQVKRYMRRVEPDGQTMCRFTFDYGEQWISDLYLN